MPLFDVTSDVFQAFDAQSLQTIGNALPDASTFAKADLDPRAKDVVELPRPQWDNFSAISRIDILNEATRRGLPSFRAGPLLDMYRAARHVTTDNVMSAASPVLEGIRAAVTGQLLTYDEALATIGTRVPVIGPFVGLAVQLYRSIRDAIRGSSSEPAARPAMTYQKGDDTTFADSVLRTMAEEDDWTSIFLPVRPGSDGFEAVPVNAAGMEGKAFRSRLFSTDTGNQGVLPELANVDPYKGGKFGETPPNSVGAVGFWQYIKTTGRDPGPEALRGYAAFYPTATQTGMYAWQRVMQVSPAMFRIDGSAIEAAWLDYFERLIFWAQTQDDEVLRRLALYAASWGDPLTFGANAPPSLRRPDGKNKFHRTWTVEQYTPAIRKWPGSLGELLSFALRQRYFKQLRPALRTLVCAYVPTDAPALLADPSLADYHDEMRRKLLRHPARFDVELDLIPDHDGSGYRHAMWQATVASQDIKADTGEPPPQVLKLASFDGAPQFDPEGKPNPGYDGPTGQGAEPGMLQWIREHPVATTAAAAGVIGVGAGAAWLARR